MVFTWKSQRTDLGYCLLPFKAIFRILFLRKIDLEASGPGDNIPETKKENIYGLPNETTE